MELKTNHILAGIFGIDIERCDTMLDSVLLIEESIGYHTENAFLHRAEMDLHETLMHTDSKNVYWNNLTDYFVEYYSDMGIYMLIEAVAKQYHCDESIFYPLCPITASDKTDKLCFQDKPIKLIEAAYEAKNLLEERTEMLLKKAVQSKVLTYASDGNVVYNTESPDELYHSIIAEILEELKG